MCVVALALSAMGAPVQAAATVFDNRVVFESFVTGFFLENFDDTFGSAESVTFTNNPIEVSIAEVAAMPGSNLIESTDEEIMISAGRAASMTFSPTIGSEPSLFVLSFAQPIQAFGIDVNSWGDWSAGNLTVFNNGSLLDPFVVNEVSDPLLDPGERFFIGIIFFNDTATTEIYTTSLGDRVGYDNLVFGGEVLDPIPTPSTGVVWLACVAMWGWRRPRCG
jgi:hypothetical protein